MRSSTVQGGQVIWRGSIGETEVRAWGRGRKWPILADVFDGHVTSGYKTLHIRGRFYQHAAAGSVGVGHWALVVLLAIGPWSFVGHWALGITARGFRRLRILLRWTWRRFGPKRRERSKTNRVLCFKPVKSLVHEDADNHSPVGSPRGFRVC
jgi:hypothetical protein